jgi:hypothetical protein
MSDDIRGYLDGEIPLDDLPVDLRREAEAWDRLLSAFRPASTEVPPPPWLEGRVMSEIEALPEKGRTGRAVRWLLRPRQVGVPPAGAGLAAAAVLALLLAPFWRSQTIGPAEEARGHSQAVVYVQFALEAVGARSVSVGGDFDEWGGSHPLTDPEGDGIWTGRVPVSPGVHSYMFLVDGSIWVTDPLAERYSDDGFGNRNAVVAVAAPAT